MADRIVLANEQPFPLGPILVSPATRTVRRGGAETVVEPRVMQVLVALARADGAVVSRDTLVERCWEGRIVGDDAINRVLSRLRALAHEAADAFRVETITRVGYRLTCDRATPATDPAPSAGGPATRSPIGRRGILAAAAAGGVAVAAGGAAWWRSRPPVDPLPPAARAAITQGYVALRYSLPDRTTEAVAAFRHAAALAPDAAEPWGKLALAYQQQVRSNGAKSVEGLRQLESRQREAVARALAIDPDDVDALVARAALQARFGNWLACDRGYRAVFARYPDHVPLNRLYSVLLVDTGQLHAGAERLRHAIAVDPGWPQNYAWLTLNALERGALDEADEVIATAFARWPRHYAVWFTRVRLFALTGRGEAARAMIEDRDNRPVGIPDWNFAMTAAEARALSTRAPADIDIASRLLFAAAQRGSGFAENAIVFHAIVGEAEKAFSLIDAYYFDRGFKIGAARYSEEQGQYLSRRMRMTWFLFGRSAAPLRADPRFAALTRAIGLDDYWRRSGNRPDFRA